MLYDEINEKLEKFFIKNRLLELHNYFSKKNETMNMSVVALAKKTKQYLTTSSLVTRISIAAGVSIVGWVGLALCFQNPPLSSIDYS